MARKKLTPFIATTPGEVLKDELIERGLTVTELSSFMRIAPSYIDDIINAKNSIDASIALSLEKALEIPAIFWLNLQSQYDLDSQNIKQKQSVEEQNLVLCE